MDLAQSVSSGLGILVLIGIIAFLFYKLKSITWYNIGIYLFLAAFWIMMFLVRRVMNSTNFQTQLPLWSWPLMIATYQFTQVIVRLPLGIWSGKIGSRQMPILFAAFLILLAALAMVIANFALWSLILTVVCTGIFGATYGLQNQYWSENYDKTAVFITVALISILPSLGSLCATLMTTIDSFQFNYVNLRWFLVVLIALLTVIMIGYWFFPEQKSTVVANNVLTPNSAVANLTFKAVFSLVIMGWLITLAFHLINQSAYSFQDMAETATGISAIALSILAIIVGLVTALWLIQVIRSHSLLLCGNLIQVLALILGIINTFSLHNQFLKWIYLIMLTIGFVIFQNVLLGVTLHFDQKNTLLFLGIWLTFRSAATGSSEIIAQEVKVYAPAAWKWIFILALILTLCATIYMLCTWKKPFAQIFKLTDANEIKQNQKLWKPLF